MTNWYDNIITSISTAIEAVFAKKTDLNSKQDTLVSGTNIKTVNNTSLLGSGNITISGGADITQSVNNGDTTHCPSGDAVYDYIDNVVGDIHTIIYGTGE